ncbi:MAG TPA: hypothetical protein ENH49_03375 [Candidatus Marinimicrobia bacterium]|nr:hypothetical protein [Candidatus Neomarinimicrobiota bacterium]
MKNGKKLFPVFFLGILFVFAGCQSLSKYSFVETLPRPVPRVPQPGTDRIDIYLPPPEEYAFEILNTPGRGVIRRNLARGMNLDSPINIKAVIDASGNVYSTTVVTYSGFSREEKALTRKLRNIIESWKYTPYATGSLLYSISFVRNHMNIKVYIGDLKKTTEKCKWIGKGFKLVWSDLPTTVVR